MKRPYLNKAGFNKLAQSIKDYVNRKITGYDKLGTASTKDFTTYVSPTQTEQLPISSSVYSAMTNMLRGAYHPAGSKTVAELTEDLLVKANLGNVYKITEDGTTSDLFIGGAGQTIKTGDNAVVLYASEDTYKFSLESGVVDLDAYQKKELTSGALIEDVIPSDASASNKLVTATGSVDRLSTNNWIPDDFDKAIPSDGASFKIFTVLNSASHTPATGANYIVIAIAFQSAIIQQEAIQNGTNNRYIRYLNNGTWSSWQKLVSANDILPYKQNVTLGSILTDIKASADAVANYKMFSGDSQTGIEGSWFGFKRTSNYWHCEVLTGLGGTGQGGMVIHLIYDNGTYTQRRII